MDDLDVYAKARMMTWLHHGLADRKMEMMAPAWDIGLPHIYLGGGFPS
jgi:hypothetical protein